jgi:tRNA pseudouridine65 synthase
VTASLTPTFLYRDRHLVAVNKPPGLAVHRGWATDARVAMTEVRDAVGAWVYPVHRLDRGASGVLLFALSPDAARVLAKQFEEGAVEKSYVALVRGAPPDHTVIDHPLSQDDGKPPRPATTEVTRLWQCGRYAWVEARPRTGRLHQIRRHLKHISCPLIGDVRYGKGEHNRLFREKYALRRLALHAQRISFRRVEDGELVTVEAPLSDDLVRATELLRLAAC